MRPKRRIHLQLPSDLEQEVRAVGGQHGIGLGPAIRVLLRQGLDRSHPTAECRDCPAAIAGLVAAEHALLVVAAILPQGRNLIAGLAPEAAAAAERRLALVDQAPSGYESTA